MPTYVYCWHLAVRDGIDLEIRVAAEGAPAARRRVDALLGEARPFLTSDDGTRSAPILVKRLDDAHDPGRAAAPQRLPPVT